MYVENSYIDDVPMAKVGKRERNKDSQEIRKGGKRLKIKTGYRAQRGEKKIRITN